MASVGMWHDRAWAAIDAVHKTIPQNATLRQRKEALKGAYPFGDRQYWPYKAWLKARRQYLSKYEAPKPLPEYLLKDWR